ncbi:hypothetical protein POHY109586_15910 [Polaromonas hydrogenivorans]
MTAGAAGSASSSKTWPGRSASGCFPDSLVRHGSDAHAASEGVPVWRMKGSPARQAIQEIRCVLAAITDKMKSNP